MKSQGNTKPIRIQPLNTQKMGVSNIWEILAWKKPTLDPNQILVINLKMTEGNIYPQ